MLTYVATYLLVYVLGSNQSINQSVTTTNDMLTLHQILSSALFSGSYLFYDVQIIDHQKPVR